MHLHGTARMHTISYVGCHVLHALTHARTHTNCAEDQVWLLATIQADRDHMLESHLIKKNPVIVFCMLCPSYVRGAA